MADQQSSAALPARPGPDAPEVPGAPDVPEGAPRAGVLHVRHRHTDRYTVVGNHLAQHPRLSATAIGLAVHIQSLPDGASVTVKALTLRFPEGETTIRKALNELEAAGYLVRRRVPLGGGRFATRTFAYDKPGSSRQTPPRGAPKPEHEPEYEPEPECEPGRTPPAPVRRKPAPAVPPPPAGPAADLLARLRRVDSRLLLATRDVQRLLPAVDAWLARGVTPEQVTRTLTANLPPDPVPIHHPARFLEYRLTALLPPPLPADAPPPYQPAPLTTCDGCDRAIRTHDPGMLCADCRTEEGRHPVAKAG